MNALDLLKQQHDEVEALFEKFEQLADDALGERRQLFFQVADALAAHTTIEEQLFYPAIKTRQTEDILRESVEEHLSAKRVIADLLDMDASDAQFEAKMDVLQELVEHHVKEEEGELFKGVRKLFSRDELEAMGEEMQALFDELMEREPRKQVPEETDQAAPV